jgi:hypothetical protein
MRLAVCVFLAIRDQMAPPRRYRQASIAGAKWLPSVVHGRLIIQNPIFEKIGRAAFNPWYEQEALWCQNSPCHGLGEKGSSVEYCAHEHSATPPRVPVLKHG